jgi:hypothetical protein
MNEVIFIVGFLITVLTNGYSQNNFGGNWRSPDENTSFVLFLTQNNSSLTGYHCAIGENGRKIDCANLGELTLQGIIQGDSAIITFTSKYCGKSGVAILKKVNSTTLDWRIQEEPNGIFFLPYRASLNEFVPNSVVPN